MVPTHARRHVQRFLVEANLRVSVPYFRLTRRIPYTFSYRQAPSARLLPGESGPGTRTSAGARVIANAHNSAKVFGHLVVEVTALLHPALVPPSRRTVPWPRLMPRCCFRLVQLRERNHARALLSPSVIVAPGTRSYMPVQGNCLAVKAIYSQSSVFGAGPFLQLSNLVCGTSLQHVI